LRPAGKHRHQFSPSPPLGAGSKTGLVQRRPFAFCCKVLRVFLLWCGRCAAWVCSCGVVLRTTPHPGLVRSWLRHHRLCSGGRFPANAPQPPGGQVKQRHARTRSCFHPRPVQPRIHAGSAAVCVLPCPLDRAAAGGGHTQAVGCAGCLFGCGRLRRLLFEVVRSRLRRHRAAFESCPDGHPGEWRRLPLYAHGV